MIQIPVMAADAGDVEHNKKFAESHARAIQFRPVPLSSSCQRPWSQQHFSQLRQLECCCAQCHTLRILQALQGSRSSIGWLLLKEKDRSSGQQKLKVFSRSDLFRSVHLLPNFAKVRSISMVHGSSTSSQCLQQLLHPEHIECAVGTAVAVVERRHSQAHQALTCFYHPRHSKTIVVSSGMD